MHSHVGSDNFKKWTTRNFMEKGETQQMHIHVKQALCGSDRMK